MTFADSYIDINGYVLSFERVNKLPQTKENALNQFIVMIVRSWTFARLTQAEKENCIHALLRVSDYGALMGNFNQRWKVLQAVYSGFLDALNYSADPVNWREDKTA